jgi:hypothetical protein
VNSPALESAVALLERGDWQAAHEIVQQDEESTLSCWAHGIVHILEGDLPNARYWYNLAKRSFPEPAAAEPELRELRKALSSAG